jgi:cupin fold WbuC family metalloprotein
MYKIHSKINGDLLHFVNRLSDIQSKRDNLVDNKEFIQCSAMKLDKGDTFKPHKHFERERFEEKYIPQESWMVFRGSVKCFLYDIDDKLLEEIILYPGDASFTLRGGHTYLILEDDTIVYEYKTGPYKDQKNDKIFI